MSPATPSTTSVLLIGPEPGEVGGMAAVVGQMLSLDFGGRYSLSCHPVTRSRSDEESWFRKCLRHVSQVQSLRTAIRRGKARIIHIHTCSGFSFFRSALDAWIARRTACRVAMHIHGAAFDEFYKRSGRVARWLVRRSLQTCDCVIALSQAWASEIARMAPRARVVIIPNAVSIPDGPPRRTPAERCRFVLLAKMDDWKGVDDLLNACATLHGTDVDFELTLAGPPGSAGDAAALARKIADRGLDGIVRYAGQVGGEAKEDLLAWADVCVQPSHHEGMPLSVLEAMANGLPVIGTRVGALPEVISDGQTGRLVPPGRPDVLAGAMREMAKDPLMRRRLGEAARRYSEAHFTLERLRSDLAAVYDTLTSEQSAQAKPRGRRAAPLPGPVAANLFARAARPW